LVVSCFICGFAMSKRKRTKEAFRHTRSRSSHNTVISSVDHHDVQAFDLRGHAKTPDALKCYLREQCISKVGKSTTFCAIKTDLFPRGCMQVLLDHVADQKLCIEHFQNEYGKVYKYHLQNPDLKALVESQGKWLTHLQMTPSPEALPPKLQGCGYRRTALHTHVLQVLEISLQYDVKHQLLDFTRRNPLRVEFLREIILWDVGVNTTRKQLIALVTMAKSLQRLIVHDAQLGKEGGGNSEEICGLELFLNRTAKEAGNANLKVEFAQRKT